MLSLTHNLLVIVVTFFASANVHAAVTTSFVTQINDYQTFDAMADKPVGAVQTGKVIKFLIDNRAYPKEPGIYYINGNYCENKVCPAPYVALHRTWAEKNLKGYNLDSATFNNNAYYTHTLKERQSFAGRIETWEKDGKLFLGVWFVDFDEIKSDMIQFALEQVKRTFKVANVPLDVVAYSNQQSDEMAKIQPYLDKNGFRTQKIGELMADTPYMGLNVGEAWGFLHFAPENTDDLEADEIPVFTELPLDLGVVAGTITTSFQDIASHVNLKAKERGTPNMVLRTPEGLTLLQSLNGKAVHFVVRADSYVLEPTSDAIVRQKFAEKINKPWKLPGIDLNGTILHYDEMCPKDPKICLSYGNRYGGKGSRLGFMAHPLVIGEGSVQQKKSGYRLTPLGFAVPSNYYKKFVDYNASINPDFKAAFDSLINSEMGLNGAPAFTMQTRKDAVARLKALFLTAQFPPGMYESLAAEAAKMKAMVAKRYPGEDLNKIKIRSSANVEDIDDFDGAGLHDSFAASLKKSDAAAANAACTIVQTSDDNEVKTEVSPKSLACAIKATYGSLWNLRAVRERSYHRFDHRGAYMGLSILPAYGFRSVPAKLKVAANSVLITRVLNTSKVYGYQISSQVEDNLVTNPTPGTIAELTQMTFQLRHSDEAAMSVFRYATPVAAQPAMKTSVLPLKTMQRVVSIARTLEEAYCNAKPDYFVVNGVRQNCVQVSNSQRKPKSLDIEIKYLSNGEILFKQSREFTGH